MTKDTWWVVGLGVLVALATLAVRLLTLSKFYKEWRTKKTKAVEPEPDPRPATSPAIHNLPFAKNPFFTGREALFKRLRKALDEGRGQPCAVTAIAGLGGVGKTQLALEWAWRHLKEYQLVWWVRAETTATLSGDLAALAAPLSLPEAGEQDQPRIVRAVLAHLQTVGRWLVIYDNAENPESVRDSLPKSGAGHVLITSRHENWSGAAVDLPINVFEPAESVEFLVERSGDKDAKAAKELAQELGHLPLALEQAAAYCKESKRSLRDYLDLFRKQHPALLKKGKPLNYPERVATTWEINIQAVEKESPPAADLLNLIAFFAPDRIPLTVVREHADKLPERLQKAFGDDLPCDEMIAALTRYSLVKCDGKLLSLHRLVQAVVRDRLGDEGNIWAGAAVEIVSAAFRYEENDIATWTPCGELLPHAFATTDHAEERGVSLEATGNLLNEAGFFVRNRADFQTARTMAKRAVAIGEETLGPVHPELATRVNNLGAVLYELGEREKAKSCFERALAIDERAFGPEHPNVAEDVNNLGSVFWRNGDHAEAMKCYDRALAIDEKEFGTDHPKVAIRVNNLGTVLYRLGESEKAKRCFDRALAIDEKVFGPEHPKVANRVNNLGALLVKMGDLTGAKAHLERAVHIFARLLGEEHPYTRGARGNLEAVERALREQNQEYSNAECGMRNGEGRGGVLTRIPACAAETDRWVGYYSPPFKWWASFCRPRTGRTVDQRAGFSMIVGLASQRGRIEAHQLHWWANVVLDSRLRGNDELMDRASSVGARA